MQELSTKEAAEAIDVPEGTLKHWLEALPLPSVRKDSRGARRFGPEALEALRMVKKLRNQDGRNVASIRMILGPLPEVDQPTTGTGLEQPAPTASPPPVEPSAETLPEPAVGQPAASPELAQVVALAVMEANREANAAMEERMRAMIQERDHLAQAGMKVAHQVGHLEARLQAAEADGRRLAESASKAEAETDRLRIQLRDTEAVAARVRELEIMLGQAQAGSSLRRRAEDERDRIAAELERSAGERARLEAELARARQEMEGLAHRQPTAGRAWWRFWA